ncbi:MAG: alpha/beta fold hydrolase [Saprospiraceae bacterium]|nr:alpha/beta fold hydrolase [Saprospiraceae bacterium]
MTSFYLEHRQNRVHCLRFGAGERLLIAVHGYGDRARLFVVLAEALAKNYTVVAIDLPFHGQTEWHEDTFSKHDMAAIVRQVLAHEGRERFNLMGFSFGARIVQALLPEFIQQLDKLYLLSPDGINTRGMWVAVHTPLWVRRLFARLLRRPQWFIALLRSGRRLGLVPGLILNFVQFNLTRPDRFRRTFGCWFALSTFYLRRRRIKALLHDSGIPVDVYFGAKDEMIRFKTLKKMTDAVPNMQLFLIDEGHRIVGENLREMMDAARGEAG